MANHFCPHCGAKLPAGAAFCGSCGASLQPQQPPQQQATQQNAYGKPAQNVDQPLFQINEQRVQQEVGKMEDELRDAGRQVNQQLKDWHVDEHARQAEQEAQAMVGQAQQYMRQSEGGNWLVQNFFHTEGRLNRLAYFVQWLKLTGIALLACLVLGGIGAVISDSLGEGIAVLIYIPYFVGTVMLGIRRCHDLDKSGWLYLLTFVPGINVIFGFYLLLVQGSVGPNQYGPDPLMH